MEIILIKKEECPYCDISLEVLGDENRSIFEWHLADHNITRQFYRTNEKIEKLIADYAHDFRSDKYDEEVMTVVFRDFYKKCVDVKDETLPTN